MLPFANRTAIANPTQGSLDWIGESIAETVRDAIGSRGAVTLSRAETEEAYHQFNLRTLSMLTEASMLKIGEAVDAEQVVYGSFEFLPDPAAAHGIADGSLKITAHIFDRRRFKQSSEFIESGNLEDLPTLEAHLAWRALVLLAPRLAPAEADFRSCALRFAWTRKKTMCAGCWRARRISRSGFSCRRLGWTRALGIRTIKLGRLHYDRKEYQQAADWLQKITPDDAHYREATFPAGAGAFSIRRFRGVAEGVPDGGRCSAAERSV